MKNEKILVVGGAGYIGSHMVKDLLDTDYGVITLDDLSTGHRDLVPGGEFIEGGLGDRVLLDNLFSTHPISAVMHFAAFSLVGESVENPLKYYRNNMAATAELLDSMIRHNVKRFIFSSTAAVYGEPVEIPITEDHPCDPTNPYGASKIAVERMLKDCDSAYGLKYISLRYFNASGADESGNIGERHHNETHLIPLILEVATGRRENIKIFGTNYPTPDGTCIRDYIHVSDLTRAHLLALETLMSGGDSSVYNLGNNRGYSVREVIELARKVTGKPIPAIEADKRPGDPAVLIASSDKIKEALGWKPKYEDLETIIKTAWVWHWKEANI
ncbi:MAG: UDP-glucose 4-epimerase GalE [Deltaproteobacteria bacterium]|nr:UDP-glucose 4-epimerase GalE [Deltaproteobacteria bacterium]MBW2013635.1 UDP-glucose 4-epimerase GalE [Deltaproteobacteria bacterium]MBW2087970.1 UDP-glucose 4-epimerase GalE [Deltaproteobacteria bacterium]MBW2319548.1 UDP-glucose 4-epimerase GalE [Deltaproteobacteria bacterium]